MIRKIKALIFLVFLAFVALVSLHLIAENKAPMTVHTLLGDFVDIASGQALMWVFILGTVLGAVLGFVPIFGYLFKIRRLEKKLVRQKAKPAQSQKLVTDSVAQSTPVA